MKFLGFYDASKGTFEEMMTSRTEQTIDTTVDIIWQKVKKKHLFPRIPAPVIEENEEPVAMEMKDKQMKLNPRICKILAEEMPEEDVIEALLDHGTSHYTFCPWDLKTHLQLYSNAKKILKEPDKVKRVTGYFMDVVGNTYCVREKGSKIPELYRHLEYRRDVFHRDELDTVLSSLYQRIWGVDLDISGYDDLSRRLSRIPYLDKSRWGKSIQSFARIIKPLLESQDQESVGDGDSQNTTGEHGLTGYSEEEVEDGLRDLAGKESNLEEFKEMISDFEEELKDLGFGETGGMGRGEGQSIDADLLFYTKLAEHYNIPVQEIPMEKSGSLHPHSHSPWEVGGPFQDIDIWTSFGKVLPGISQVWNRIEGEVFGEKEATPDCIIVIDSSGSMVNPARNLSYAVLGAGCASDAYLRSGSHVAVYNFSDATAGGKELLDFTQNRRDVYRSLCKYFGGGTNLKLKDLETLRKKSKTDIFIITDMQITNLEKVIDYFSEIENRITAVYIGKRTRYAKRFFEGTQKKRNISLYRVEKKEDIPKIVLGRIKEYFNTPS